MKQRRRIYYSETQKALMWGRWQKGESLQHIAQLFDRNHSLTLQSPSCCEMVRNASAW
jgi:hypothetical protein